jgi:hypothetical protein
MNGSQDLLHFIVHRSAFIVCFASSVSAVVNDASPPLKIKPNRYSVRRFLYSQPSLRYYLRVRYTKRPRVFAPIKFPN